MALSWPWSREDPRDSEIRWLRSRVEELESTVERLKVSGADYVPKTVEDEPVVPALPAVVMDAIHRIASRNDPLEAELSFYALEQLDQEKPPEVVAKEILQGQQPEGFE